MIFDIIYVRKLYFERHVSQIIINPVYIHTTIKFVGSVSTVIIMVTQPSGGDTAAISTGEVGVGTVRHYIESQTKSEDTPSYRIMAFAIQ